MCQHQDLSTGQGGRPCNQTVVQFAETLLAHGFPGQPKGVSVFVRSWRDIVGAFAIGRDPAPSAGLALRRPSAWKARWVWSVSMGRKIYPPCLKDSNGETRLTRCAPVKCKALAQAQPGGRGTTPSSPQSIRGRGFSRPVGADAGRKPPHIPFQMETVVAPSSPHWTMMPPRVSAPVRAHLRPASVWGANITPNMLTTTSASFCSEVQGMALGASTFRELVVCAAEFSYHAARFTKPGRSEIWRQYQARR
jgi:hypothetical protein